MVTVNDSTVRLTGVEAGSVEVIATDDNGLHGSAQIQVGETTLDRHMVYLKIGGTIRLMASGGVACLWSSDHSDIAEVDQTGTIKAKKAGTATITVWDTASYNEATMPGDSATVVVADISILPSRRVLAVEDTVDLQASVSPSNYKPDLSWSSNNTNVAIVNADMADDKIGKVEAIGPGEAVISVTDPDSQATAQVQIQVVSIVPSQAELFLEPGKSATMSVQGGTRYSWVSNNTQVAEVSCQNSNCNQVTVLGKGVGVCQLQVQEEISTAKTSILVKVIKVSITPATASIGVGRSLDFTVSGGSGTNYVWSSSNTGIAEVDNKGRVTGLAAITDKE